MDLQPVVSVVIAVKNSEIFLQETLESIKNQSYQNYEVILIDGNSTDKTSLISSKYKFTKFFSQNGEGIFSAWNEGILKSRGEFIAIIDSDDKWTVDKLKLQVSYLNEHPEIECVIGKVKFFSEDGLKYNKNFNLELLNSSYLAKMPGASLIRKRLFEKIGYFEEKYQVASDISWFAKLKDANIFIGEIDEVLIEKRVHENNFSYNNLEQMDKEMILLLKESIIRQRENNANKISR